MYDVTSFLQERSWPHAVEVACLGSLPNPEMFPLPLVAQTQFRWAKYSSLIAQCPAATNTSLLAASSAPCRLQLRVLLLGCTKSCRWMSWGAGSDDHLDLVPGTSCQPSRGAHGAPGHTARNRAARPLQPDAKLHDHAHRPSLVLCASS